MVQDQVIATRIPNEIFYQILSDPCLLPRKLIQRYDLPIKYAHVCREWRDITLACPKLWSRIYVHESAFRSPSKLNSHMERCRFHVEQAAAAPLDVMFFSFRLELHPVLELLLAQAHRTGTFALESFSSTLAPAFLKEPSYEFLFYSR